MIIQKVIYTKEECEQIIEFTKKYQRGLHIDNNENNPEHVTYTGYIIPHNNKTEFIWSKLYGFFEDVTGIQLYKWPIENAINVYKENDKFGKHHDAVSKRIYSVGILLNDDFEGGDFIINEFKLDKVTGNTYIFNADEIHEITKITKGIRYALISFVKTTDLFNNKTII